MKRATKGVKLLATNKEMAEHTMERTAIDPGYRALIMLLADVCDTAITEGDCYLQLGMNRGRDALLLKVVVGGEPMYISGLTLIDLMLEAQSFL